MNVSTVFKSSNSKCFQLRSTDAQDSIHALRGSSGYDELFPITSRTKHLTASMSSTLASAIKSVQARIEIHSFSTNTSDQRRKLILYGTVNRFAFIHIISIL